MLLTGKTKKSVPLAYNDPSHNGSIIPMYLRLCLIPLILLSTEIWSQEAEKNLKDIERESTLSNALQKKNAIDYAKKNQTKMVFMDDQGNSIYLVGIDEYGHPIYRTTLNAGAAETTRANKLNSGGTSGLSLDGQGITIGVWDESLVKDHVEFDTRLQSRQGDKLSLHATHVTGTILATGLQPLAKGMASKAHATTWDFDNDVGEMASLAKGGQNGLILSNHSYGNVMGFYRDDDGNWQWAGDPAISETEDYRFGFYSNRSRIIDNIAFNAPYYTIVWAGGNDRAQTGDGSHPPDGNGGYDLMGDDGGAKNVITVGAVEKVVNYTGPSSIVMSNFSSWGPTDDGRIKPDLVGAGVSLYSTSVSTSGTDQYTTTSGTSMAAPNVTGSLALLQQLYRDLHGGSFMHASTLKALAIHTAKEAGLNPGPDYSYGWGLLDVEAAANVLLNQDQKSGVILENQLLNRSTFEFPFEPKENTKVTATLVWTDPAGTPVNPVLDPSTRMLVNDLDIRIFDSNDNTTFPWRLNRENPAMAAERANNNVDNVEKIEFSNPEQRSYTLKVSHRGQLLNDHQNYSLILTFTPADVTTTTYYWRGNSGNWNDPSHWSLTSGGSPANIIPDANSRVMVDANSFSLSDQTISLTADATCKSITWLTEEGASLALNNNTLNVNGNFVVSNSLSVSTAGQIELSSPTGDNRLSINGADLSNADLIINGSGNASWTMEGVINTGKIILEQGILKAKGTTIKTKSLIADSSNEKALDLSDATMTGLEEFRLNASGLQFTTTENTQLELTDDGASFLSWPGINFNGTLSTNNAEANMDGETHINKVVVMKSLTLTGNNSINDFTVNPGATINIEAGTQLNLTQSTLLNSSAAGRITFNTIGEGPSTLNFAGHYKLCFDYLDVNGVGIDGTVKINAGVNSVLSNAANWSQSVCDETLFADFSVKFNCEGALTEFVDLSEGNVQSWNWNFGDPSSGANISDDQHPRHVFDEAGTFIITITVSDGNETDSYSKEVNIINNPLPSNAVIQNNQRLFSEISADFYQWYKDGDLLNGETQRSYEFNGEQGAYFVLIRNQSCNRPSSPFVITGDEYDLDKHVKIYPNPAQDRINIELPPTELPARISLINTLGQDVLSSVVDEQQSVISLDNFPNGVYIINVLSKHSLKKKIIINH